MSEYIFKLSMNNPETIENDGVTTVRMGTELQERIVRCRDCVFFTADVSTADERGEQIATGNICEWTELWVEPDGFCAWAERRTDDN